MEYETTNSIVTYLKYLRAILKEFFKGSLSKVVRKKLKQFCFKKAVKFGNVAVF